MLGRDNILWSRASAARWWNYIGNTLIYMVSSKRYNIYFYHCHNSHRCRVDEVSLSWAQHARRARPLRVARQRARARPGGSTWQSIGTTGNNGSRCQFYLSPIIILSTWFLCGVSTGVCEGVKHITAVMQTRLTLL